MKLYFIIIIVIAASMGTDTCTSVATLVKHW